MSRGTLRLAAHPMHTAEAAAAIEQAAAILRAGGTVAFATETVYGLGANAFDPSAVEKIFVAKHRPAWDPLIVHVADPKMLAALVQEVPEPARLWMESFWPGPLTLLLPRSKNVPDAVTAGRPRIGVRMPRHPVAQALLTAARVPVAAPSANLFGHVSPTTAEHVLADLDGRIDAVLDGGPAEHGLESTVVDTCESPCVVYRPGAVTLKQLRAVWPAVELFEPSTNSTTVSPEALPSPGVGLRHYAPRARLLLAAHGPAQAQTFLELARQEAASRLGILLPEGFLTPTQRASLPPGTEVYPWGRWNRHEEMAQLLFSGLRELDDRAVNRILCPLPAEEELGIALCDRLRKAARANEPRL